jgi:hypothetical protein
VRGVKSRAQKKRSKESGQLSVERKVAIEIFRAERKRRLRIGFSR